MDWGIWNQVNTKQFVSFFIFEYRFVFGKGGGGDVNPNFQHWGLFSYGGRQVYADVYR